MKTIEFTKMAGAGNDFIVINAPKQVNLKNLAIKACDRTNGIGADGLLILDKSKIADYKMRIINADGSEAEMCGNGARCMAAYIVKNQKPKKNSFTMETLAGSVTAQVQNGVANVKLSNPVNYRPTITILVNDQRLNVSYIDTGVPHTIIFVDSLDAIDVKSIGNNIRSHQAFKPKGTNVNFVEQITDSLINVRTYERGVEDETKACGTGSVASAIVTFLKANPNLTDKKKAKMKVKTRGNEILEITFDITHGEISNVWLKGSANFIATGEYCFK